MSYDIDFFTDCHHANHALRPYPTLRGTELTPHAPPVGRGWVGGPCPGNCPGAKSGRAKPEENKKKEIFFEGKGRRSVRARARGRGGVLCFKEIYSVASRAVVILWYVGCFIEED